MTYNFTTLTTALDTKAQAIAADSSTTAKDLIYLAKAIEAINAQAAMSGSNNLSELTDAAAARTNLGLPTIDITGITNDQILVWNAALTKFQAGSVSSAIVSQSNPTGSETGVALGDMFVNSDSGEIFIVHSISGGVVGWLGTLGGTVNIPQGQAIFFNPRSTSGGTSYHSGTFTVPDGITEISVVMVGGGAGGHYSWASSAGGGGGLAWANNIPVLAGDTIDVYAGRGGDVGGHGYASYIAKGGTTIIGAYGGQHSGTTYSTSYGTPYGGSITTNGTSHTITPGNSSSGRGGLCSSNGYGGGGGAGGYSGNGGNGSYGSTNNGNNSYNGTANGTGGAGGGGGGYDSSTYSFAGGGGTGLFGEGLSGAGMMTNNGNSFYSDGRYTGKGGSGGEDGSDNNNSSMTTRGKYGSSADTDTQMSTITGGGQGSGSRTTYHGHGGMFGGGGGGGGTSVSGNSNFCLGGNGGVRIIWGKGREFPKTRTGNVTQYPAP